MERFTDEINRLLEPCEYWNITNEKVYKDGILVKNKVTETDRHGSVNIYEYELMNGLAVKKRFENGYLIREEVYNEDGLLIYEMEDDGCTRIFAIRGRHWTKDMSQDESHFHDPTPRKKDLTLVHKFVFYKDCGPDTYEEYDTVEKDTLYLQVFDRTKSQSAYTSDPKEMLRADLKEKEVDTKFMDAVMAAPHWVPEPYEIVPWEDDEEDDEDEDKEDESEEDEEEDESEEDWDEEESEYEDEDPQ